LNVILGSSYCLLLIYLQVIARIFYSINRSWSGQITPQEVRKSSLLQA